MLEVNQLKVTYGGAERPSLSEISFELAKGQVLGIVGANGSGKSTLCNRLVGLIPGYLTADVAGQIMLKGRLLEDYSLAERLSMIGLVFQNPFNQLTYTASTVAAELAYGLENLGVERVEMVKRVRAIAKMYRLEALLDRSPLTLSGGQVQRVALASCLIMEPEILILDEPTSQLDPVGSRQLYQQVRRLVKNGLTCLVVSHDLNEVERLADRVLVLKDGHQVATGKPNELFQSLDLVELGLEVPDYIKLGSHLQILGELPTGCFTRATVQKALNDLVRKEGFSD